MFTSDYMLAYVGFLRVVELSITSNAPQDRVMQLSAVSFANTIELNYSSKGIKMARKLLYI